MASGDMSSPESFTAEQIAGYRAAFLLFSKDADESVPIHELPTLLRSFTSLAPDPAQLQEIVAKVDPEGSGSINFTGFLALMGHQLHPLCCDKDTKTWVTSTFQAFDPEGTGRIPRSAMFPAVTEMMRSLGEALTIDEVIKMVMEAGLESDGQVDYYKFIEKLYCV